MKIVNSLILLIAIGYVGWMLYPRFADIRSVDAVLNTDPLTISNDVPGRVRFESTVETGAVLNAGDPLYEIVNTRYGRGELMVQYSTLKNQLANVVATRRSYEIERRQLQQDRRRQRALAETANVALATLEKLDNEIARLADLISIYRDHEADTRDALNDASQQLELWRSEVGKAPCDGVIWSKNSQTDEYKSIGSPLLSIIDPREIWVDAYFSVRYAELIEAGMEVTVEVIADGRTLLGRVEFVRSGVGRIAFDSAIEVPPESLRERLIVAHVRVSPDSVFTAQEFFGVGRSVRVWLRRGG
jgi:multidrug resistance efflux pump